MGSRDAWDRMSTTQLSASASPSPGDHSSAAVLLPRIAPRPTKVGLVAGGLGAYWPQFPDLLPQLQRSADRVSERMRELDCEVVDVGFISDAQEGARAAEELRAAGCDIIVAFLTTYMTATMLVPVAQRSGAPVLLLNLQPTEVMDHATFDTGQWLAYCGACPLPEMANAFRRCGIETRSVSGYLEEDAAWERIAHWVRAAGVRGALRHGRHGLMGHLYPGMLDVATDLTSVPAQLGGHIEVLEIDDLRVRVEKVTETETDARVALAKEVFQLDPSVVEDDLRWGATVSVALDRMVEDFELDSLAYYHRGLDGEMHEKVGAGLILGASLLTARGIPQRVSTSCARRWRCSSWTGSAPAARSPSSRPSTSAPASSRWATTGRPTWPSARASDASWPRRLSRQARLGRLRRVRRQARPRDAVRHRPGARRQVPLHRLGGPGRRRPHLAIGNTTSRVDFGCHPGLWTDAWSVSGVGHHWALGTGHRAAAAQRRGRPHGPGDRRRGPAHVTVPAGRRSSPGPRHRDQVVRSGQGPGGRIDHAALR